MHPFEANFPSLSAEDVKNLVPRQKLQNRWLQRIYGICITELNAESSLDQFHVVQTSPTADVRQLLSITSSGGPFQRRSRERQAKFAPLVLEKTTYYRCDDDLPTPIFEVRHRILSSTASYRSHHTKFSVGYFPHRTIRIQLTVGCYILYLTAGTLRRSC